MKKMSFVYVQLGITGAPRRGRFWIALAAEFFRLNDWFTNFRDIC